MADQPTPTPEERDAAPERRVDEDAARYPRHEDPDEAREDVGLDRARAPEPEEAPPADAP